MPGVIGDLRGQRFGRLKVPDGADPVIHNHNAYRPVIYDAARWAWSLDSTCLAGSQAQTGRAAPGDHGAGGTATRSCVFRPATNDAFGQIQVRRPGRSPNGLPKSYNCRGAQPGHWDSTRGGPRR